MVVFGGVDHLWDLSHYGGIHKRSFCVVWSTTMDVLQICRMAEFLLNVIQLEIMARSWISEDHLGLDASAAVVGDAAITAHLWGNSEGK